MKIAIYARYSSDLQNPTSIDDQILLCQKFIKDKFNVNASDVLIFSDYAQTGANLNRDDFQNLVIHIKAKQVDVVVSEGLDRISRSLTDTSSTFDIFSFYDTKIVTVQEGEISELHIGLKGTMNNLFLKDLKTKIKRGLVARASAGYCMGKCSYGYDIVRGVVDEKNRNINGIRKINPEEAKIVIRIFEEYASGRSLSQIVGGLNNEKIPTPRGGKRWKCHVLLNKDFVKGGLLRNELYIGNILYNKSHYATNPETKKKIKIPNLPDDYIRSYVPELRIISDELWQKAREREIFYGRNKIPLKPKKTREKLDMRYNQSVLTNFVFCGVCGGQKSRGKFTRYICDNNRYKRGCENGRSANEQAILEALSKILWQEFSKTNLKPLFEKNVFLSRKLLDKLEADNQDIEERLNKLVYGIEYGINGCMTKAIELKKEQLKIIEAKKNIQIQDFPEEEKIREKIRKSLFEILSRKEKDNLRQLLHCLVKKIILTPIEDKRTGETITIYLQTDGWLNFWNCINKK